MNHDEYIGRNVDEVVLIFKQLYPGHMIQTVVANSTVTRDHLLYRYRLWYDRKTSEIVEITNG